MCELAERDGVELGEAWACGSLGQLIEKAPLAFGLIRTPDDLVRLCREFVEDEAAQGVWYTEPMMGVGFFSKQFGLSPEETFAVHEQGMRSGSAATGVQVGYMFGILRHESPAEAEAIARFAAQHARPADEAWQTPWERDAPDEEVELYERGQFEHSVAHLRSILAAGD